MKALSVCQPWAWLIVAGHKDIENRSWFSKPIEGQRIAIHASMTMDSSGIDAAAELGIELPLDAWEIGSIVGLVTVVDAVRASDSRWFIGPIGWRLRDAVRLETPVPCLGRLKLWELPPLVLKAVCG